MDKFCGSVPGCGEALGRLQELRTSPVWANTIVMALAATAIGCIIGLVCGILNTISLQQA